MVPRDMRLEKFQLVIRRAVADADQAGQLDMCGQTKTA